MRASWRYSLLILAVMMLLCGIASAQVQQTAITPDMEQYRPSIMPDRIVLNWSGDTAHSQSVTWRTDTSITSAVAQIIVAEPGPRFEAQGETVPASSATLATDLWPASYHSVTFRGLNPDTLYAYRVGDGATHWSEWFQFRTASETAKPFSFLYFGDPQLGPRSVWSRTLREAFKAAPDARFMTIAGDLVNAGPKDADWGELVGGREWIYAMIPLAPASGNHEYQKDASGRRWLAPNWRAQFTLPLNGPKGLEETAYYVDFQGVRLIALNFNELISEQTAWLDKVLSNNPNRWTVVVFHCPMWRVSANGDDHPQLRAEWKPLFDKYGVDLVLTGHQHCYARSGLEGAAVYVTSVGGWKMYPLARQPWMKRAGELTQLFQVIRIDGDKLSFQARTATGQLYDAFELKKTTGKPNVLVDRIPSGVPERVGLLPPPSR